MKFYFVAQDAWEAVCRSSQVHTVDDAADINGAVQQLPEGVSGSFAVLAVDALDRVIVVPESDAVPVVIPRVSPVDPAPAPSDPSDEGEPVSEDPELGYEAWSESDTRDYLLAYVQHNFPDAQIEGTGADGYVKKDDIVAFLSSQG